MATSHRVSLATSATSPDTEGAGGRESARRQTRQHQPPDALTFDPSHLNPAQFLCVTKETRGRSRGGEGAWPRFDGTMVADRRCADLYDLYDLYGRTSHRRRANRKTVSHLRSQQSERPPAVSSNTLQTPVIPVSMAMWTPAGSG